MLSVIEMELKAVLKNKLQVREKLKKDGCKWVLVGRQEDTIYEKNDTLQVVQVPIFRIRKCDDNTNLTLKVLEEDVDTAEELELSISDGTIMDKILQIIGFSIKVKIVKRREITKYKGFNICIDEVEGLGDFIEIERMSEKSTDKNVVYQEIKKILFELGIEEQDLRKEKYYKMLLKKEEELNE